MVKFLKSIGGDRDRRLSPSRVPRFAAYDMNDRCIADLAASRRLRRLEGCDGKARNTAQTPGRRRRTRGQVSRSDEGSTVSNAEHSEDDSVHDSVAVDARVSGPDFALRPHPDGRCAASGRHNTILYRRSTGQCEQQLPVRFIRAQDYYTCVRTATSESHDS